jgi:hypothetical protein
MQYIFFAGTENKFDLFKINWLCDIFFILLVHKLIFVRWRSYSNNTSRVRLDFIIWYSSQIYFNFSKFIINLIMIRDHVDHEDGFSICLLKINTRTSCLDSNVHGRNHYDNNQAQPPRIFEMHQYLFSRLLRGHIQKCDKNC